MNVRRLRSALGWILALVILAALVVPLARNFATVRSALAAPNVPVLLSGSALLALYFVLRAALWFSVTQALSVRPRLSVSTRIWFLTEFSRYLPGNVWSFLGRAGAYRIEGVPVRETAAALIREALTIVAAAAVLVPLLSLASGSRDSLIAGLSAGSGFLGVIGVAVLLAPIRVRSIPAPGPIYRLLGILLGFLAWIAFGFGSALVLRAFHAPFLSVPELALASIGAWLFGYLSLVTPSGLGVREAAIQQYLVRAGGTTSLVASALSLVSRLVLTVVECVLVLIVLIALPRTRAERGT